jgi:hypothetical protein
MHSSSVGKQKKLMGQTTRTTKLLLDLSTQEKGGATIGKRVHLAATVEILNAARRSVIEDVVGKARGYLTSLSKWQAPGKKKGKPGTPTATNHPTLYAGTFSLDLDE